MKSSKDGSQRLNYDKMLATSTKIVFFSGNYFLHLECTRRWESCDPISFSKCLTKEGQQTQKLIQGGRRSNPSLDNEYAIAMAKISQTRILDGFMIHEYGNFHPAPSFT